MKHIVSLILLITLGTLTHAQSNSYLTMKDTFHGGNDVHSFSVSGFLCRVVLTLADEHEFRDAITEISNIKVIMVPKTEFTERKLSVSGFKQVLSSDSFQELANFSDHGDQVTFFIQENGKHRDRYFILVDDQETIVGIEMRGTIDMNKLMSMKQDLAMNKE